MPVADCAQPWARGREMVTATVPREQFRHLALSTTDSASTPRGSAPSFRPAQHAVTRFLSPSQGQGPAPAPGTGADSAHLTLADIAELAATRPGSSRRFSPTPASTLGKNVSFIGEPIWPGRTAAE